MTIGKKLRNIIGAWGIGLIIISVLTWFLKTFKLVDPTGGYPIQPSLPIFIAMCILAPLWEELVFRAAPVKILRALKVNKSTLWTVMIALSAIFGFIHGGVVNVYIQGIMGIMYTWVYIKNGDSFISAFITHSLWNFGLLFLLKIIV